MNKESRSFILRICLLSLLLIHASIHVKGAIRSRLGFGTLGCWRDHPASTKSAYSTAVTTIRTYLDSEDQKPPGDLLKFISQVIWPVHEISEDKMYCFDEEYHGGIAINDRRSYVEKMQEFRLAIQQILNTTTSTPSPRNNLQRPVGTTTRLSLREQLHEFYVLVTELPAMFFKVYDIELSSLFLREYILLSVGSLAEYINYCKTSCSQQQRGLFQKTLERTSYIMAKYSYWFIRFMPKKMADNYVLDSQRFSQNQLGITNQITGKRLSEYDDHTAKCGVNDNNNCHDYILGLLKSVRISARQRIEEYWKDLLFDFRQNLFKRYCTVLPCRHDRYDEFLVKVGEPIALQYQAPNGENSKFCASNYCSTMWLSTGGHDDYGYYRQCLGANPLDTDSPECIDDIWKICSHRGGCKETSIMRNKEFPVVLQSNSNKKCLDCSMSSSWCKQGSCPSYTGDSNTVSQADDLCRTPQACTGPQYQIHNFRAGNSTDEPFEVLDEIHFSHGALQDGHLRMLSGDIYSGAFLRTQYYVRLEHKFSVASKRTGETTGPFYCPIHKPWQLMHIEEQAVCSQSSYTIFKNVSEGQVLSPDIPATLRSSQLMDDEPASGAPVDEISQVMNIPRDDELL